jgi:SHS2 domain-containing protein
MFEFLDHTAEKAVRLRAPEGGALFREAVRATLALYLGAGPAGEREGPAVERRASRAVRLEAEDPEALLVDFLNEIVYLFETERFLAADLAVGRLDLGRPSLLEGRLEGETLDPARHAVMTDIKAVTFHGLEIREAGGELEAEVVFDI